MTDATYTKEEIRQAMRETGNTGLSTLMLDRITEQADKNRAVKQGTGFSAEQVREAVSFLLTEPEITRVMIRLHGFEVVPEPSEGGVYKSPAGVLYRRQGGFWERFGTNVVLTDDQLNYPVSQMERVL